MVKLVVEKTVSELLADPNNNSEEDLTEVSESAHDETIVETDDEQDEEPPVCMSFKKSKSKKYIYIESTFCCCNFQTKKVRKKASKTGTPRKIYSQDDLKRAIAMVRRRSWSLRKAAKTFGVPHQTLHKRLNSSSPYEEVKSGPKPEVPLEVENEIEDFLIYCAQNGFPRSRLNLVCDVKNILDNLKLKTKFVDNKPSLSWVSRFVRRHPRLRLKGSEHHAAGKGAVTKIAVKGHFSHVAKNLKRRGIEQLLMDAKRKLNMDEAGFRFNVNSGKVIGVKGQTTQRLCDGNEKECVTVVFCFSADGNMFPPTIVSKGQKVRVQPEDKDLPVWRACSTSGWMTSEVMLQWCKKLQSQLVQENILVENSDHEKVLLFFDGHSSHLTYSVIKYCQSVGIELVR